MKGKNFKSLIAIMMAVVLVFGAVPFSALADAVENISTAEEAFTEPETEESRQEADEETEEESESEEESETEESEEEPEENYLDDEEKEEPEKEEKKDEEQLPLGISMAGAQMGIMSSTIKVIVDFEGYNLGQGFYIKPTVLEVPVGSTAEYATKMLLDQTGHGYDFSGDFLKRVQGFDTGTVTIPSYLEETIEYYLDGELDPGSGNGSLGTDDYFDWVSSWMVTINHELIGVGVGSYLLTEGDVIRWQFSLWTAADMGFDEYAGEALYDHADKTALIRALTADGADPDLKAAALDIVINPLATAQEVADALAALGGGEPEEPVDKAALKTLIDRELTLDEDEYTTASWSAFSAALLAAKAVCDDSDATQAEADDAAADLQAAIAGLTFATEKDKIIDNMLKRISLSMMGSDDDWKVVGMMAYGASAGDMNKDKIVEKALAVYESQSSSATDFERVVISMTALGINAAEVDDGSGGYADFIEKIASYSGSDMNNANAYIHGLLAYDSGDYTLPAGAAWTREIFVSKLLSAQEADGGWGWGFGAGDPDLTAMAISALAKYRDDEDVEAAIEEALLYLQSVQAANGGIVSWGAENTCSAAMVIIALSALGMDADDFAQNGNSVLDALLSHKTAESATDYGFGYADNIYDGAYSTEQGFRALVAYANMKKSGSAYNIYVFDNAQTEPSAPVDKSLLNAKIQEALVLPSGSYTSESWTNMMAELLKAQAVAASNNADWSDVYSAITSLDEAIKKLRTISTPDSRITVTFALYGAEGHSGDAKYIYKQNPGVFLSWITSTRMDMNYGDTAFDVFEKALAQSGIMYNVKGSYINSVCSPSGEWLSEFANGEYSGWMYLVNGNHPSAGIKDYKIQNGDAIVFHYTDDFRLEQGSEEWSDDPGTVGTGSSGSNSSNTNNEMTIIAHQDTQGNATVTIAGSTLNSLVSFIDNLSDSKGSKASIVVDNSQTAKSLEFILPQEVLDAFYGRTETSLEIKSGIASITLDSGAIEEIVKAANGQEVKVVIEIIENPSLSDESKANVGDRKVYSTALYIGEEAVEILENGQFTILLPYEIGEGERPESLHVYSLDKAGNLFVIDDFSYDENKKGFVFTSDSLGMFAIGAFLLDDGSTPLGFGEIWEGGLFLDVPENHWAYKYIEFMVEMGFVHGVGGSLFAPERDITRAEFVTLLFNMSGDELPAAITKFSDVSAIGWYAPYIAWALENGIAYGTGVNTFSPDEMITLQDMVIMLVRYAELAGLVIDSVDTDYIINGNAADYAEAAMDTMTKSGILASLDNNSIAPPDNMARAQAVAILAILLMEQ